MGEYRRHVKSVLLSQEENELIEVDRLAQMIRTNIVETQNEIARLHVHGASSLVVQNHFAKLL